MTTTMTSTRIVNGTQVYWSRTFKVLAGTASDPDTVVFKVKNPAGTTTTYTYGTSAEVTKSATGVYQLTFTPTTSGPWQADVITTGSPTISDTINWVMVQRASD